MKNFLSLAFALLALPALAQETRVFTDSKGHEVEIPVAPERVVTLQDQNALLPLMELGFRPIGSAGHIQADGTQIFRRMEGYDTDGIAFVGSYREPDIEAVAALEPDLIIAPAYLEDAEYQAYSTIAPTLMMDVHEQPLEAALFQFADVVNRTEQAKALQDELKAYAEDIRARLGDRLAKTTLSVIRREWEGDGFTPMEQGQAYGSVLALLRPTLTEAEESPSTTAENMSLEALGDHAADVMFFLSFDHDLGGNSAEYEAFMALPLVQALPVAKAGQLFPLDGSAMVGASFGKIRNGLDQISEVLLRDDLNRDLIAD